jgi:hypothetical protein
MEVAGHVFGATIEHVKENRIEMGDSVEQKIEYRDLIN